MGKCADRSPISSATIIMGVANDGQAMAACMDYQANHVKCTEAAGSVWLHKNVQTTMQM